jgi:outer membrane protein TolC
VLLLATFSWPRVGRGQGLTNAVQVTPAFINELAEEARTNNPALLASFARASAAEANVHSIRIWENPVVSIGTVAANRMMRAEDGDLAYGIEQALPLFGKPGAARELARAEGATAVQQADFDFQMLRLEIAKQVLQTALADDTVGIGREDLAWLEANATAAEERYRSGAGSQIEVLRLQNERAIRFERLRTDEAVRDQQRIWLNRLLNRSREFSWPRLELPPVAAPVVFSDRLRRLTLGNEARLKLRQRELDEARAQAAVTRKSRLPEIMVGLEGRQYSGSGEFREGMLTLSLSLPWVNRHKYRADLQRDEARVKAAELEHADYSLFVPAEAQRVITAIDAARREALVYRDQVIPRSEQALQTAQSAWMTSRGIFLDLMEARRMLLEARLMYVRAVAEQYQMLSELTLCCGVADLEALEMLGSPNTNPESEGKESR